MKQFIDKYKVLLTGLLAMIGGVLQEVVATGPIDFKVLGIAVLLGALGFLGNAWRGQGASLTGILGTVFLTFTQIYDSSKPLNWSQFGVLAAIAIIFTIVPDPKSRGYEQTDVIVQAKKDGEDIQPAALTNKGT